MMSSGELKGGVWEDYVFLSESHERGARKVVRL